jgi:putative alpha-1,2-mannosidase
MKFTHPPHKLQHTDNPLLQIFKSPPRRTARLIAFTLFCTPVSAAHADPVDWVNLFIGTGSGPIGYGGTMPFVTPPFGMTDWTAQTRQNKLGGVSYKYEDTTISGFMGTHQPAIWMGDYGYVTLMPEVDSLRIGPEDRKLPFTHHDEIARPDYYSVSMDAGGTRRIRAEMTATERCAYLRFTFPANASSTIIVEASRPGISGFADVDVAKQEITGYNPDRTDSNLGPMKLPNFKGYLVIQFRKPFNDSGTYGPTLQEPELATGAYAKFKTTEGEVVEARVATSFISMEQARQNLKIEMPVWDFDGVRGALRATWNEKLGRVAVEGATEDQRKIVYTGCITRCSTLVSFQSRAVTTAPSMAPCTKASRTPPTPFGTHFVLSIAYSLCSLRSESTA